MGVSMQSSQVECRITLSRNTKTENISVLYLYLSKTVTVTTYRVRDPIYCV